MPSSTFLNLAPEKQEKLLSAAVREFTERPYNEASINRIVREAGIPRGSFYMYFRDKEDLFHYLVQESIQELLVVFEEILRGRNGDVFAALLDMYDYLRSHPATDCGLGGPGMMSAIVNRNGGLQKGGGSPLQVPYSEPRGEDARHSGAPFPMAVPDDSCQSLVLRLGAGSSARNVISTEASMVLSSGK